MAHRWWMTTTGCTPPSGNFLDFLAFLFLSPCPQRALLGSVNLVSLVVTVTARRRLRIRGGYSSRAAAPENEALIIPPKVSLTLTAAAHFRYAVAFGASAVFSAASVVLLALALLLRSSEPWRAVESAFLAVHAAAHGTAAWTVASSERGGGGVPAHLRVFWIATALGGALLAASAAVPGGEGSPLLLYPDDVVAFGYLLLSLPLAYVAATGFFEFEGEDNHDGTRHAPVPPYESASLLSLATFSWVNALISKGYAAGALTAEDVPPVPAGHRAEAAYDVFASHWPAAAQWSRHAVGVALCLSFWRQLLLTAVLGVASMAATYVGPSLVDTFVQLIDSGGTAWEALRLILILIAGKTVQTLASRHYSFQCALLEMRIRGALRTALYRKSLFLSTRARRAHGAGAIVNYMQADATNVSSAIQGIHGLWMTPLQIVVALLLPYEHFGPALFMAFAVIAAVTAITRFSNNLILNYQTKFLRFRDDRIKATTEMLNHMRLVKLQAWEEMFGKKVRELRQSELGWLRKIMILRCANDVVFSCAPSAMGVLVFGTYLAFRGQLDPGKVFTATAFFSTLAEPMRDYPQVILSSVKALVSLARLNDFLTDAEISRTAVQRVHSAAAGALAVKVEGGVFAWDQLPAGEAMVKDTTSSEPEMEAVLKGIDLELRKGELAAVVGTVGSGKSSLLSCIMGEMHKVSGQVSICGSIAFVAQTAWIQNGTIQENILFGKPLHGQKYSEAIRACCLEKDLQMMELGDSTEIGENGINLSAGQKQRIQLARAVYQDCDIYLLDDIFSAVDAHVGSTIFMRCLKGILKNKTVLLATHQLGLLKSMDTIYVMKDGQVIQSGGYQVLLASCLYFSALVAAHHSSMEKAGEQYCQVRTTGSYQVTKCNKYAKTTAVVLSKEAGSSELIQKEEKESGRVSWRLYKLYMTEAYGWLGVLAFLALSALPKGFSMLSNYWLSYKTSGDVISNNFIFMVVYVSMLAAQIVFEGIRTFVMIFSGLLSAQTFFNKMFDSILRAPMSFFDITPSGRILSRASSDQEKIDFSLVYNAGTAVSLCISVFTIIVATCQAAWPSFILVLPLLFLNIRYQNLYVATSRELTRLQGVTEAPVIDHFKETFLGTQTVRCFEKEKEFYQTNLDKINSNLHMSFHNYAISEWLGFRMDLIGTVILSATAFLMVILPSDFISKELVGMSISGGLSLNSMLLSTISIICMIENDMVALERVSQYCNLTSEARWEVPDSIPSPDWPRRGDITVKNLKIRYRQNAPLILNGITISIKNGEKIGVVGRTGSGKTTLILALFRLVEPTEGNIVIDGVNICTLGLHDLRSRFGIIPQEPALFEGTLRNNIDPAGLYSDAEIWQALNSCQLKDLVASKPEKLDTRVADMGNDWSVGQKQLLCFCRVLLKGSQILFMDEATSSVDPQTDATIHSIIRKKFANYTVISIAHRIPTVKDSDRVLVLDAGEVKEFDAPSNLMGRPSAFAAMVREYEIRSLSAQPSTSTG